MGYEDDLKYYKQQEDYDEIAEYLEENDIAGSVTDDQFPSFQPDFSSSIIIDNVPKVGPEKVPKLLGVLLKIYQQIQSNIDTSDFHMPISPDTNETFGFCFVKFKSKAEAEKAISVTQGLSIDKKHSFQVSLYSDLEKYATVPDEYVAPPPAPFNTRPDPISWLADPKFRDQFVIRRDTDTEIFWASNIAGEEPEMAYGGEREKAGGRVWCDSYVCWSPQGTYLATIHAQGIKLWGGEGFESQGRFMHAKVDDLSFSPCENYLITYRYTVYPQFNSNEAIIVWHIRTGEKLRTFELENPVEENFHVQATIMEQYQKLDQETNTKVTLSRERVVRGRVLAYNGDSAGGMFTIDEGNKVHEEVPSASVIPIQEPNRLKWSPDGKYVARLGFDKISIRTLPSMQLLDKKSIAAKDVLDFVWSPRSNMISYWSPAVGNHPALINIIQLPERTHICSRKLFDVTDGRMIWQNEGDFLCVYMTKVQGKKKTYVLMLFRVRDSGVPVEQIELNEPIINVAWEPSGDRFVIMYGEGQKLAQCTIAFYQMHANLPPTKSGQIQVKMELTHLHTKNNQSCSEVLWSPAGGVVALAYFASDACVFELFDVDNIVSMANRRHDRCNKLYWDPSGRYLVSCTITDLQRNLTVKGQPDDGYNVWSFQGALVTSVKKEKLFQFAWRPRPKDLLKPEEKKKVIKNLKKYEKIFEREDKARREEMLKESQAAKDQMAEEFFAIYTRCKMQARVGRAKRVADRGGYDSEDDSNYRTEHVIDETILSTKEVVMN